MQERIYTLQGMRQWTGAYVGLEGIAGTSELFRIELEGICINSF